MLLISRNLCTTPEPNVYPAPLSVRSELQKREGKGNGPRRNSKILLLRVGVGPDEVSHGPLVGDLAEAVDDLDLVDGVDRGREAAVDAEDLACYDGGDREGVEYVDERLPDFERGTTFAFVVEAVYWR